MFSRMAWLRSFALIGVVTLMSSVSARAMMEAIDFNSGTKPTNARQAAPIAEDDEDEDSFFSNSAKSRNITGTVVVAGPLPRPAAAPRPVVDVVATCRAVLADNLDYYKPSFVQNCRRAVIQDGRR